MEKLQDSTVTPKAGIITLYPCGVVLG